MYDKSYKSNSYDECGPQVSRAELYVQDAFVHYMLHRRVDIYHRITTITACYHMLHVALLIFSA